MACQGRNFNIFLGGARALHCENLVCDLFLVTIVHQMVLGPVSCPAKYSVLSFLPSKMANFQCLGGDSSHLLVKFLPGVLLPSFPAKRCEGALKQAQ